MRFAPCDICRRRNKKVHVKVPPPCGLHHVIFAVGAKKSSRQSTSAMRFAPCDICRRRNKKVHVKVPPPCGLHHVIFAVGATKISHPTLFHHTNHLCKHPSSRHLSASARPTHHQRTRMIALREENDHIIAAVE
jgi:hypothetical protein